MFVTLTPYSFGDKPGGLGSYPRDITTPWYGTLPPAQTKNSTGHYHPLKPIESFL